jgi:hypothetical protein
VRLVVVIKMSGIATNSTLLHRVFNVVSSDAVRSNSMIDVFRRSGNDLDAMAKAERYRAGGWYTIMAFPERISRIRFRL